MIFQEISLSWVSLREDTAFWLLDHNKILLYGSYGGACHSFNLFAHRNCNSVHLSWISHIHYRTMLVAIPFYSLLQSEKKRLPLSIRIGFDYIWDMQSWSEEISGFFSHWSRVGKCLVVPMRSKVSANMLSSKSLIGFQARFAVEWC